MCGDAPRNPEPRRSWGQEGSRKGAGAASVCLNPLPSPRYDEALLEDGRTMHRLRHSRVVKLLGVIMEDGNYSLVMEYVEKGDLMRALKAQVPRPESAPCQPPGAHESFVKGWILGIF